MEIVTTIGSEWKRQAIEVLAQGELVAFPTDTVYGLGADAFNDQAVRNLYLAKGRSQQKAIPVLVANLEQFVDIVDRTTLPAMRLVEKFWPGPLTIVLRHASDLADAISTYGTVGVRIPDHPIAQELIRAAGPLAVTSANRSGDPEACTAEEIEINMGDQVDLIVDGGRTPGGQPSTVVDCTQDPPRILRVGPISEEEIRSALLT
ncbi:MAG: L-threonylcarbamoyladenylate synthase [Chloroflexota bacterium]|nr:L-threonylcarbamoyladenylate synthase [Chloroflexota bacterium]